MTTPMGCSEMTGWRARFVKIQGSKMAMHQASRRTQPKLDDDIFGKRLTDCNQVPRDPMVRLQSLNRIAVSIGDNPCQILIILISRLLFCSIHL